VGKPLTLYKAASNAWTAVLPLDQLLYSVTKGIALGSIMVRIRMTINRPPEQMRMTQTMTQTKHVKSLYNVQHKHIK